jgi:hypothetical protein
VQEYAGEVQDRADTVLQAHEEAGVNGGLVPINELLLVEFDEEMKKTRATLERVPADKPDFTPHPRSMPLGRLAPLVAQLPGFGLSVLTTPEFDFAQGGYKPVSLQSAAQLVGVLNEGASKTRKALAQLPEGAWNDNWKLMTQGKSLFEGTRFLAYRQMFLNHLVHHRAQLGIYLRLNEERVPAVYGPSADETLGF